MGSVLYKVFWRLRFRIKLALPRREALLPEFEGLDEPVATP